MTIFVMPISIKMIDNLERVFDEQYLLLGSPATSFGELRVAVFRFYAKNKVIPGLRLARCSRRGSHVPT